MPCQHEVYYKFQAYIVLCRKMFKLKQKEIFDSEIIYSVIKTQRGKITVYTNHKNQV